LALAPRAAQQPVFRAGTRLIVQTVSVKDKEGRAIEGLMAKDFVVVEDGEPQTISFVEFQRLPDRRTGPQSSGSPASAFRTRSSGSLETRAAQTGPLA